MRKAVFVFGLSILGVSLLALLVNLGMWAGYRLSWTFTGDYTAWVWFYGFWPTQPIIFAGVVFATFGCITALLSEKRA